VIGVTSITLGEKDFCMRFRKIIIALVLVVLSAALHASEFPTSPRAERAIASLESVLEDELQHKGLSYGAPIFIRIFKEESLLEVWVESATGGFRKFKDYKICTFSGNPGPKEKTGDLQSPEGFYFVNAGRLNPWSRFHLSFNLGYPNRYDRYHGRTGSALMVHGNCVSIGCYAMTDQLMTEIYALSAAALKNGQPFFRVHVFPFKLEADKLAQYKDNKWYDFWLNLKDGYDYFIDNGRPPNVTVENGVYVFGESDG